MKKLLLLLCGVLLHSFAVLAQKDAPVAGHAAALVDLLKKDYNAIDPELRGDEIVKDRALVISIFKSYLTDEQRKVLNLSTGEMEPNAKRVREVLDSLNTSKKTASTTTISNPISADAFTAISKNVEKQARLIEQLKTSYFEAKSNLDNQELDLISLRYKSGSNEYLATIVCLFASKYSQLKNGTDGFASSNYTVAITKSIPFIGGELAFETVIDGLSRFLAKRIKEELTSEVILKVQDWLKKDGKEDPLAEFKTMLPRTTQYLKTFQAEKITNFPDEIKQYIEDDLNHALENAAGLKDTPRIKELIEKHPDLDFAMEAIEMIPNLSKLKNPADYFKTIENSRNLRRWKRPGDKPIKFNIANLIQLSGMIGQSVLIVDNGEVRFAGKDFMGAYVGEKNFFVLFLGFLYQQNVKYYDIQFRYSEDAGRPNMVLNVELKKIVSKPVDNELVAERRFFNFMLTDIGDNAEKVLVSATEIRKANKAGKKIGADSVYRFVESMINLSENVVFASGALVDYLEVGNAEHITRLKQGHGSLDRITAPYFTVARSFNEIAFDIQKAKYANALTKVIELKDKLADQAVLSNDDIISRAKQLDYIHWYPTTIAWPHLMTQLKYDSIPSAAILATRDTLTRDITFMQKLAKELGHTQTPSLDDALAVIKGLTPENLETRGIARAKLDTILTNKDLLKVAAAYYTGINVDKIISIDEIKAKRARFPCEGDTCTGADQIAIDTIIAAAQAHVVTLSDLLIDGSETNKMLTTKNKLESTVNTYLASFGGPTRTKMSQQLTSLIHFVNDMAVAKDAEDVEKAIEAFALPAGSYSIKRTSKFNFSINSFPGILPAYEVPWKKNEDFYGPNPEGGFSIGLTAPVGLSLAWGWGKKNKCLEGYSMGFFIPVIDVGAITRLRLDTEKDTEALPKMTFRNFLSPGLYFHVGFPKTPLSLNIGAQFGPEMRKFTSKDEYTSYDSIRFGLGLVLDIPLLNLHTKPRIEEQ